MCLFPPFHNQDQKVKLALSVPDHCLFSYQLSRPVGRQRVWHMRNERLRDNCGAGVQCISGLECVSKTRLVCSITMLRQTFTSTSMMCFNLLSFHFSDVISAVKEVFFSMMARGHIRQGSP